MNYPEAEPSEYQKEIIIYFDAERRGIKPNLD